jgi:hypothetical protein
MKLKLDVVSEISVSVVSWSAKASGNENLSVTFKFRSTDPIIQSQFTVPWHSQGRLQLRWKESCPSLQFLHPLQCETTKHMHG